MNPFPAFLKLRDRSVLLVGGGRVAAGKLASLLEAGARVTVVAPRISVALRQPGVVLICRPFDPVHLEGRWFVVSAAPPAVNRQVALAAEARRVFVNAADDVKAASAYLGSVVRSGGVTFAISTGGRAPALAALLREALQALLPEEIADWMATAERLRAQWRAEGVPMAARRPLLLRALDELYSARSVA
jgi:uroporphyrin-III C-methyltransferase/precorrin-2 dehydrogenase/sirohydrochlorin ferrochelatase